MADVLLHSVRSIPPDAVLRLYAEAGRWPERKGREIAAALAAGPAAGAWVDDELVGFARAVMDGRLRAYLEDVVVGRGSRGRGVGTQLVQALLAALDVEIVSVFCGDGEVGFYEGLGLRATKQRVLHLRR
jgi:GNAT superfamily N-acetyltransferase